MDTIRGADSASSIFQVGMSSSSVSPPDARTATEVLVRFLGVQRSLAPRAFNRLLVPMCLMQGVQPESIAGSDYLVGHDLNTFQRLHPRCIALTCTVLQVQFHLVGGLGKLVRDLLIVSRNQLVL